MTSSKCTKPDGSSGVVWLSCGAPNRRLLWVSHVDSEGNRVNLWKKNTLKATEHEDVIAVLQ